ncbi:MAG: fumarylacetoacetate hydrolase family protein [Verrucomicrobia bacterium]|nr:fumarylacetoacetate hydrolase family protein [Verrucomicrobiota bacterium]
MKIIRFTTPGLQFPDGIHFRLGVLDGERVVDLTTKDPDTFGSVAHLLRLDEPAKTIADAIAGAPVLPARQVQFEAPLDVQEVWAAGVTYLRACETRKEEAARAGSSSGTVYDKVYNADRPELFLKATPERAAGPEQHIRIRADSRRTVPEPELALALNYAGVVVGYTIGNDMSARDIEIENPLYVQQAKLYRGGCALGPCILLAEAVPDPKALEIEMRVDRGEVRVFQGKTSVAQMKRGFDELAGWLFRENDFPGGVFLLTGAGVVPPENFALDHGDTVEIEIGPIGVLRNEVE